MLKKLAALPVLILMVVVEPLQAMAQQQTAPQAPQAYYGPGPWQMWNDGYGWHFWWMFPLMMLFIFFICGMFFLFARRSCGHGLHHWGPPHLMDRQWNDASHSAMQILNERFARGEIQKDEYLDKKAIILSGARH
jgi:putative membrane protein